MAADVSYWALASKLAGSTSCCSLASVAGVNACLVNVLHHATDNCAVDTLTADALSECFGIELEVDRRTDGRWSAWAPR